jgi:hypothetical protein
MIKSLFNALISSSTFALASFGLSQPVLTIALEKTISSVVPSKR